jgi:hypothetical protein
LCEGVSALNRLSDVKRVKLAGFTLAKHESTSHCVIEATVA